MDNQQVQQPAAPVAAPLADLSLDSYRAARVAPSVKEAPAAPEPAHSSPDASGASGDELDTEGTTPEQQTERKKKLGGFQKTISRQAEEIAELKRQLDAKASAEPAKASATATPAAVPAKAAPAAALPEPVYPVAKPKLEDCESIEDFTEKLNDWKHDERDWRKEQKAQLATRQAEADKLVERWKTSTAAFKEEHEDYDAALANVADIKLSAEHQKLFLNSEHGVALAYELANEPDALRALSKMPVAEAARALGRREAKYAQSDAPEPEIKVSSAPKPFKPVSGNGSVSRPNPATMSAADYRKARESGRMT